MKSQAQYDVSFSHYFDMETFVQCRSRGQVAEAEHRGGLRHANGWIQAQP